MFVTRERYTTYSNMHLFHRDEAVRRNHLSQHVITLKMLYRGMIAGLVALLVVSCNQKSTESLIDSNPSFAFRPSKCAGPVLLKGSGNDSSFTYTFADTLSMDFSVSANCCSDSDRFDVANTVGSDTLSITIIDTAAYGCRCNCLYFIHAELAYLPEDHYVVRCRFVDLAAPYLNRDPAYLVDVYRAR